MSEPSQEQAKTRRFQRLLDRATAAAAEAKYPSDPSIENIPSAHPRKSVRSPSRTESLPSGLVKSKVRRTAVPQSEQSRSYPSSKVRSYHSSEVRSYHSGEERSYPSSEVREQIRGYPCSEVIKSESESYKVEVSESDSSEENQSEQFQFEPSTSTAEFSARKVPTQQYEKFEAPEEEELSEHSTSIQLYRPRLPVPRSFTSSQKKKYSTSGPDYRRY